MKVQYCIPELESKVITQIKVTEGKDFLTFLSESTCSKMITYFGSKLSRSIYSVNDSFGVVKNDRGVQICTGCPYSGRPMLNIDLLVKKD